MKKLGTINKATASVIITMIVTLVNKYTGLGLDLTEQGMVSAGLVGIVVWWVPNIEAK